MAAVLERAGAAVEREPGFLKDVVDLIPAFSTVADYKADLQTYLDRHDGGGAPVAGRSGRTALPVQSVCDFAKRLTDKIPLGQTRMWGTPEGGPELTEDAIAAKISPCARMPPAALKQRTARFLRSVE